MENITYSVVVTGELRRGVELEAAKQNVAALFRLDTEKVERLFCGAEITIKRGMDPGSAARYAVAINKAGLVAKVEPPLPEVVTPSTVGLERSVQEQQEQQMNQPGVELASAAAATGRNYGRDRVEMPIPSDAELAYLTLDAPGVRLSADQPVVVPSPPDSGGLELVGE